MRSSRFKFGIDYQKADAVLKSARKLSEIITNQYPPADFLPDFDLDNCRYTGFEFTFGSQQEAMAWMILTANELGLRGLSINTQNCHIYSELIFVAYCYRNFTGKNPAAEEETIIGLEDWFSQLREAVIAIQLKEAS